MLASGAVAAKGTGVLREGMTAHSYRTSPIVPRETQEINPEHHLQISPETHRELYSRPLAAKAGQTRNDPPVQSSRSYDVIIRNGRVQIVKIAADPALDYGSYETLVTPGTDRPWKDGATPNSIYVQHTLDMRLKSVSYYDAIGIGFSREDYVQKSSHPIVIGGTRYNLNKFPHEHRERLVNGPVNDFSQKQIRVLDINGKPITGWEYEYNKK